MPRAAAQFVPDGAAQVAVRLHSRPIDVVGPVVGLADLALWASAAVLTA